MAENSGIEWTTHTFNPWRGCAKVSPGCANCYADTMSKRNPGTLGVWGPNGTRVVAAGSYWKQPLKWNKEAACTCGGGFRGKHSPYCPQADRPRVFCASLADVFEDWNGPMVNASGERLIGSWVNQESSKWEGVDNEMFTADPQGFRAITMDDVRRRLFALIDQTPHLDWLLLTKRPENIARMMPPRDLGERDEGIAEGDYGYYRDPDHAYRRPNVWLGVSVEDQQRADERIPHLLQVSAAVRFLSCEPLLGPVKLDLLRLDTGHPAMCVCGHGHGFTRCPNTGGIAATCGRKDCLCAGFRRKPGSWRGIDWVIVGGESGPGARPMQVEWARSLVKQCQAAGVACFVKQLGSNPKGDDFPVEHDPVTGNRILKLRQVITIHDKKGGDIAEWPADLRVREFPAITHQGAA